MAPKARSADLKSKLQLPTLIQNRRKEINISISILADYLGVSVETIEQYERGEKSIPLSHIYSLANCLNIDPDLVLKLI